MLFARFVSPTAKPTENKNGWIRKPRRNVLSVLPGVELVEELLDVELVEKRPVGRHSR
jgi:hypothetical protein